MNVQREAIYSVPVYNWYQDDAGSEAAAINGEIEAVLQERADLETERARNAAASPIDVDYEGLTQFPKRICLNAVRELKVRQRAVTFAKLFARDQQAEFARREKGYFAACEKVVSALRKIGYLDGPRETPGTIHDEYVSGHPSVIRARIERDDIRAATCHRQEHQEAIGRLETALAKLRVNVIGV